MPWVLDSGSFKYIKVRLWQFVENSVENLFNKTQSPDGRTCSFEIIRQKLSNKFVGAMLAGQAAEGHGNNEKRESIEHPERLNRAAQNGD